MNDKPIGQLIDLPSIADARGNLVVAEQFQQLPFAIKRVYWTYGVPEGEIRGGHAHRCCRSAVVAASGSFKVTLDDGSHKQTFHMAFPYQALVIETGIWRTLEDFSSDAVCLVMASEPFEEADYIRDYQQFLDYKRCSK